MKRVSFPIASVLALCLATSVRAGELPPGADSIPAEEARRLDERINDLFPKEPKEPPPAPTAMDKALSPFATLVYLPGKAVVAVLYTLGAGVHLAAFSGSDAGRIFAEGVTGEWVLTPKNIAGADPIDIVGPDREFPGHNPVARATFIRSYYMLYSSQSYRGVPEGSTATKVGAPPKGTDSTPGPGETGQGTEIPR